MEIAHDAQEFGIDRVAHAACWRALLTYMISAKRWLSEESSFCSQKKIFLCFEHIQLINYYFRRPYGTRNLSWQVRSFGRLEWVFSPFQ